MQIRLPALLSIGAALAGGSAFASMLSAQVPMTASIDQSLAPYASHEDSVRLPDGRRLHLVCMGQGSPTVILTAGNTRWSVDWNKVQAPVAAHTRVCAWDRAGFGLSDPPSRPQNVDETSADLAKALEIGGIAGPYILVGHSLGGYESLLLADRQRASVVGMVMVDSSIPDQAARFERVAPAFAEEITQEEPLAQLLRKCSAALRSGALKKGDPDPDGCLRPPPAPANYPPELIAVMPSLEPASEDLVASAMESMTAALLWETLARNSQIVVNPARNYGSIPVVVLTADLAPPANPDWSAQANAQDRLANAEFRRGHAEYAALSSRGTQRTVPGSTHFIQQTNPEAVTAAIVEVLQQARALD
jgi:pimeloyl-ACP methyl ester carboxylesterase